MDFPILVIIVSIVLIIVYFIIRHSYPTTELSQITVLQNVHGEILNNHGGSPKP